MNIEVTKLAEGPLSCSISSNSRPIPFAVLKVQLKRLVRQHQHMQEQTEGVIATKDLLTLISAYEREHDVILLTDEQKQAIHPYTLITPDLEMTPDDILNLLKLVFTPSPTASLSAPTSKLSMVPRTSAPLSNNWKRRLSTASMHHNDQPNYHHAQDEIDIGGPDPMFIVTADEGNQQLISKSNQDASKQRDQLQEQCDRDNDKEHENNDEQDEEEDEFAQCYRRSLALTQRLKLSEKSLASMTRDNEDRIIDLQNKVDEMTKQVNKQKRELLEYKTKEISSLEQISMLEQHIDTVQQSETDQKQVFLSIKTLFDEKCGETHKLQELLKQKELDLQKTEAFLSSFHHEFMQLTEERNRLESLQQDLERELATSQFTHTQLAEQRSENERLKQVIDTLKCDLDQARHEQRSSGYIGTTNLIESLEAELEGQLQLKEFEDAKALEKFQQMQQTEARLKSAESEKDYYKSRATEAMEDLDRVKDELSHLKKVLDSENRSLVTELADLQTTKNNRDSLQSLSIDEYTPVEIGTSIEPYLAALPIGSHNDSKSSTRISEEPLSVTAKSAMSDSNLTNMNRPISSRINRSVRFSQQLTDVWSQSRIRGRKLEIGKKREVFDLHDTSSVATATLHHQRHNSMPVTMTLTNSRTAVMNTRQNDKLITSTATFAIYTLLVYIFGIVTSTFLIENGTPGSWEQALVAAANQQGGGKSKLLEILLYWIEKLLFEGEGVPLS